MVNKSDNIKEILNEKLGKKYLCENFDEILFDVMFENLYNAENYHYDKIIKLLKDDFISSDPFEHDKQEVLQEKIVKMFFARSRWEYGCFNELREYYDVIHMIERLVKETKFMNLYGEFIYKDNENITEGVLKVLEPKFLEQNYDMISLDAIFEIICKEKIFEDKKFIKFMIEKYFDDFTDSQNFLYLMSQLGGFQYFIENNVERKLIRIRDNAYYKYIITIIREYIEGNIKKSSEKSFPDDKKPNFKKMFID